MVSFCRRVDWPDVDYAQVVYFLRYQEWVAEGFHRYLYDRGFHLREFFDAGFGLPYVDTTCRFRQALTLEEEAEIQVTVAALDARGFTLRYRICRRGQFEVVAEGEMVRRCISRETRRSTELPMGLHRLLAEIQSAPAPWHAA